MKKINFLVTALLIINFSHAEYLFEIKDQIRKKNSDKTNRKLAANTNSDNTLSCLPKVLTRNQWCPGTYVKGIEEKRYYRCPAGYWTYWQVTSNNCAYYKQASPKNNYSNSSSSSKIKSKPRPKPCYPRTKQRRRYCPGSYKQLIIEKKYYRCPGGYWTYWQRVQNLCSYYK